MIVALAVVLLALAGYLAPATDTRTPDLSAEVAAVRGEVSEMLRERRQATSRRSAPSSRR